MRRNRLVSLLVLAGVLACSSAGSESHEGALSGSRTCAGADHVGQSVGLDAEIAAILAQRHVPGVAVAIVKGGTTVFAAGYGIATRADTPQTARSIHVIASASKPITAVAILQLAEAGKLRLDDDVDDLLRGVPLSVRNPKHPRVPITVRELLTHTSSIVDAEPYWDPRHFSRGDPRVSVSAFVRDYFRDAEAFLDAPPGTISCYTNIGVGLLSMIVEVVSGMPFAAYAKKHVFDVLGMADTSFLIGDACDHARLVEGLAFDPAGWRLDHYGTEGQPESHPELASGMLRTTALDMAKYVAAITNDGSLGPARILSVASAQEMKRRQLDAALPSCDERTIANDQGLLAYYSRDATDTYFGHSGSMRGAGSDVFYRTSDNAGFVVLANVEAGEWLTEVESALFRAANQL